MSLAEMVFQAHRALDNHDLDTAMQLVIDADNEIAAVKGSDSFLGIRANLGAVMIDLGTWTHNEELINKGTLYTEEAISASTPKDILISYYYNAANGYFSLWSLHSASAFHDGRIEASYFKAKNLYRNALRLVKELPSASSHPLMTQLLVNYGNCLDSMSRCVDAVSQYDRAIKMDPTMGEALGNKGITLHQLAFLAEGHTHLFLLEAHRLLELALNTPVHLRAAQIFQQHYDRIQAVKESHEHDMEPEEVLSPASSSPFHDFLRNFCARHRLYLTPTVFIGPERTTVYGDAFFISRMIAPIQDRDKFDRYVAFLNEIKQDYVFARYLLVQSQYRTGILDTVDLDVTLYYPLDYSLQGVYIQALKSALRLAIDLLDKIAYFVRDYCDVQSISDRDVNFRNIWATKKDPFTLREELASRKNSFLFALFDLALELAADGEATHLYQYRNALTHRFLIVHEMLLSRQNNTDIPRVLVDDLIPETILALQIARSAVMYLILFVDTEERKLEKPDMLEGLPGVPVDDVFRWFPSQGQN